MVIPEEIKDLLIESANLLEESANHMNPKHNPTVGKIKDVVARIDMALLMYKPKENQ